MFITGVIGWFTLTLVAIFCTFDPESQTVAIVFVIAGVGFGVIMQLAEIAIKLRK